MINDWLWPNPIWQQVWCNEGLDDFKNRTSAAQKAPEWLSYWTSEDSSAHGLSKPADPEELWATNIRPLKGYSLVPIHSTSVNQAALVHLANHKLIKAHQSFKLQHCAHLAESYPILLFLRKVVVGSSQIHSTRNIGSTHVAREKGRVVTFLLMFRPLSGCPWCGWKFGASHGKFWN